MRHIAIAGAGVIGLACALELRRRGLAVTVFESGSAMREASWAAGGMLAVDDPENPSALLPLSRYSRSLYDGFLAEITRLSGLPIPVRTRQTLQAIDAHRTAPTTGTRLTRREAQQHVPGLTGEDALYLLLEEASLDPRDLCLALPVAARAAGVVLREHEPIESVTSLRAGVCVTAPHSTLHADAFLNCAGAWSAGAWATQHSEQLANVLPRKGQMMVVAAPPAAPLTCVLRSPEVYLIPRGDGRIAIGATVEDAGYSKSIHHHALERLRGLAAALWPPIADAPLMECWAGLRPATEDGLPLLGPVGLPENRLSWIATGHYRNGILLAPGTAACMAALLLGEPPPVDIGAFAPHRTPSRVACDNLFMPAL